MTDLTPPEIRPQTPCNCKTCQLTEFIEKLFKDENDADIVDGNEALEALIKVTASFLVYADFNTTKSALEAIVNIRSAMIKSQHHHTPGHA